MNRNACNGFTVATLIEIKQICLSLIVHLNYTFVCVFEVIIFDKLFHYVCKYSICKSSASYKFT